MEEIPVEQPEQGNHIHEIAKIHHKLPHDRMQRHAEVIPQRHSFSAGSDFQVRGLLPSEK